MTPFATVDDLEARWRKLADEEVGRAEVLLEDASAALAALCGSSHLPGSDVLRLVCCNVVKREMQPPLLWDDAPPMSQMTQTAGSYSVSATLANPAGDLYLTAVERQMLGLGECAAFCVVPDIPGDAEGR